VLLFALQRKSSRLISMNAYFFQATRPIKQTDKRTSRQ